MDNGEDLEDALQGQRSHEEAVDTSDEMPKKEGRW